MKNPTCNGAAFRTVTVASTIVIVLLMACPAAATPTPPAKIGDEVAVSAVSSASKDHNFPDTAKRPDGTYVVVWQAEFQDGSRRGIYMQLFNADRSRQGDEVLVNTNTAEDQELPRVAASWDNSFVVAWESEHAGTFGIYGQRFDSSGAKVGEEFRVSTEGAVSKNVDVAYLINGDVVFCWRQETSSHQRTFIRRYSSDFIPLGGAEMSDNDSQAQFEPRIAALPAGGFVVVFSAYHNTSTDYDVHCQLFAADATAIGVPFRVNLFRTGNQRSPYVAAFVDGSFIIAWHSAAQDGNGYGCYAQHLSAAGTPIGDPFIVNTITTGQQLLPKIATFSDNSFAIAWYGDAGVSSYEVSMQYFDAARNKIGAEDIVNTMTASTQSHAAIASNWFDGGFAVFYGGRNFITTSSQNDIVGQWFAAALPPTSQTTPPCTSKCLQYFCPAGQLIPIKVTGVLSNDVYGSQSFSDDSNVAAAAVFAGVVAVGETAVVTAKCAGPQQSFASGSAHGVTTQAFASAWPASFTFDLGSETQAPQPPSPARCYNEPCALAKCAVHGTSFNITVDAVFSNNVWGSDAFSDDSWVGSAAVHQGLLRPGTTGSVTVYCSGSREALVGTPRHGVVSNAFGPWQYTYTLHALPTPPVVTENVCVGACLHKYCPQNAEIYLRVSGTTIGSLWGSSPYTGDSSVSAAAVHAGLATQGTLAIVKAVCTGSQSAYTGTTQNGVVSASYGVWASSFTLSPAAALPTVVCGAADQCLKDMCAVPGRVIKVSVTGSKHSATQFWGTTRFTDDSPLSHAAVHEGLVLENETKMLFATCQGPHATFAGSTSHGITSTAWNAIWPGSFTLAATL